MTENKIRKTSTADFFAKYKDPRWQKKRLEVMRQANFRCESCESKDKTLNVHHKSYKKNQSPWEYDEWELECLCEDCHSEKHKIKERLTDALHDFKTNPNFSVNPEEELLGFLEAKLTMDMPVRISPTSYEYLRGYCTAHLLDVDEINLNGKLDEIISTADGWLNVEMFNWAFKSPQISEPHAEYVQNKMDAGHYSHYPNWLM
jgi:hypothetical protein